MKKNKKLLTISITKNPHQFLKVTNNKEELLLDYWFDDLFKIERFYIAKSIAKYVNEGFFVFLITYDDILIRELNNLIMLYTTKDIDNRNSIMKKYGYEECHLLNPNDLEVRDREGDGKIKVTELGFSIPSIDNEINSLNNRSEEIYLTLHSK
jgi:hypothetical protein